MLKSVTIAAPRVVQPAYRQSADEVIVERQDGSELHGDWVLGTQVTTPDGDVIGSIGDLILDKEDSSANASVVSVGGFLGFGTKQIAVDWSEPDMTYDGNEITLGITREEAGAAPEHAFRERIHPPPPEPEAGAGTGDTGGSALDGGTTGGTGTTGTGGTMDGQ
ncbi:MAG: PRC-barrel domain [Rhodobacteraceae bacterium HLUCCO18]|nr:MAG: PRC-barrel domain [Rhodobacteraceae bacterium HLUCCO18]